MKFNAGLLLITAMGLSVASGAQAQDVLSRELETQAVIIQPIPTGTDGMGAFVTRSVRPSEAGAIVQEEEVTVLGFQIPDFDPEDLTTRFYHVGMFSNSGNGSGTAYPDDKGYVEYELRRMAGQGEWQTFLYSVHAETGEVQVFIDIDDMSVNNAVMVLTNLALNAQSRPRGGVRPSFAGPRPRRFSPGPPPAIGDERRLGLHGDYLALDDLQEQIFQETRCNVEQTEGVYYLASCD